MHESLLLRAFAPLREACLTGGVADGMAGASGGDMKLSDLFRLARKSIAGITELGASLNITHTSAETLTTIYNDALSKSMAYQTAKSCRVESYTALVAARTAAEGLLERARDFLKLRLGSTWSDLWAQAGFPGPLLSLPNEDEDRITALQLLKNYFVANPTHEGAAFSVTAAEAQARLTAFLAAVQETVDCTEDQRAKRDEQRESAAALLKKLRALWNELESLLEPLDSRWLKFMDRVPGDPRIPEQVLEVDAVAQPGGVILLDWEDAVRAASYKVYKQVEGVDAERVLFTTVDTSDAQVTGVPSGALVRLTVVASNAVGDAAPSDEVALQAA